MPSCRAYLLPDAERDTQALAEGFHLMAGDGKSFALLLRYQAQADRQYRRAVEDFQRLNSKRRFPKRTHFRRNHSRSLLPVPPQPPAPSPQSPTPKAPVPSPRPPAPRPQAPFSPCYHSHVPPIHGIVPAMITPMRDDERVDYDAWQLSSIP